jgi:hypothetical protein
MKNNCSFIVITFNKALTGTIFFSKYNISYLNIQSYNIVHCNQDIKKIIEFAHIINKNWILNNIHKSQYNNKYHHHLPFFKKTSIIKHLRRLS